MLIAVEGLDGAGKSTLVEALAESLGRRAEVVVLTRYTQSALTSLWKHLIASDTIDQAGASLLAAADYHLTVERLLKPALARDAVVIADRYVYSHRVYFATRGVPGGLLDAYFGDHVVPDLVLYLFVKPGQALNRMRASGKPDIVEAGLDYRLGLSIGKAHAILNERPLPAEEVEQHFLAHAEDTLSIFERVLPEETVRIDAAADKGTILGQALCVIDGIRAGNADTDE